VCFYASFPLLCLRWLWIVHSCLWCEWVNACCALEYTGHLILSFDYGAWYVPVFVVVSLILFSKYSVTNPKELSIEIDSLLVGKFPILYRTQCLGNKDTLTFKVLVSHVQDACTAAPQATYFIYLGNKVTYWVFKICSTICIVAQNAVNFIILFFVGVHIIFTFYIKIVLKFKYPPHWAR
jgi:hypothetical protein